MLHLQNPLLTSARVRVTFIVSVLSFLMLPLLFQHSARQSNAFDIANVESRTPATFPRFPTSRISARNYSRAIDRYLEDHFGLRHALLSPYSEIMFTVRSSISQDVVFGQSDWLYHEPSIRFFLGDHSLTDARELHWLRQFQDMKVWLLERDIDFLIVAVPNKPFVEQENLPKWIGRRSGSPLSRFMERSEFEPLAGSFIDLTELLKRASSTEPLYLKFDTHWNHRGAYVGYREIVRHADSHHLPVQGLRRGADISFQQKRTRRGNLSRRLNRPFMIEPYSLELVSNSPVSSGSAEVFTGSGFVSASEEVAAARKRISHYSNPDGSSLKVLLLRDSFGDLLVDFMRRTFADTWVAHHWSLSRFHKTIIDRLEPDLVILEFVHSTLSESDSEFPEDFETLAAVSSARLSISRRTLEVRGWALSPSNFDEVTVESELGRTLGRAEIQQYRPDVYRKYPAFQNDSAGWEFSAEIDAAVLSSRYVAVQMRHESRLLATLYCEIESVE